MNCVCIVCYLFFYKDYCADTRGAYIFLLHKKTPALPSRKTGAFKYTIAYISFADYTIPCAIIALATFMNPATLAPFT